MRLFVLVLLAGCQLTVYAGPRFNANDDVTFEFGASMGPAVQKSRRGNTVSAVAATVDATIQFDQANQPPYESTDLARSTKPPAAATYSRGTMRGILEYSHRPLVRSEYAEPWTGIGWRVGVYGGADTRRDTGRLDDVQVPLVGALVSVTPFLGGCISKNGHAFALGIGVQVAAESLADGNAGIRTAISYEMQFLPNIW